MTTEHKLKLIPARFRWFIDSIKNAQVTYKLLKDGDTLAQLRKEYHDDFIELDRQEKSAPERQKLQGRMELIDEFMEYYG